MATVGNERYLRHIWLLGDGGLLVLRGIVSREASTCGQPFEKSLDGKRSQFNNLLEAQRLKLFPDHSTVNNDTKTWDMSLLITVVRKIFWANLSATDKSYIKALKTHRDELKAHPSCMSMGEIEYNNSTQLLKTAICHLASGLSADTNTQLQDIIKSSESETIDIKSALQHITELNEYKETFLQELEKSILQVTSEIQKVHSSVNNLKADIDTNRKYQLARHHELSAGIQELTVVTKMLQEDISEIKEQVNVLAKLIVRQMNRKEAVEEAKRTAVKELEIILPMQCEDNDKREKATNVLYDMIKLIQTGYTFSEEKVREMIYQKIRENGKVTLQLIEDVIAWFKDIDEISDSCLGFAHKGSIRIPIQCFSENGFLSQMYYINSSKCLGRLQRISSTLSKLLGFMCAVVRDLVPYLLTYEHKEQTDKATMGKDQLERHHELSAGMQELNVVTKKSQEDVSEIKERVNVITDIIFGQMNRKEAVAEAKRTAVKELEIIVQMNCEDNAKEEKATDVLYDIIKLIQTGHNFSEEGVRAMIHQRIRWFGKITLELIENVIVWFRDIDEISDSRVGFAYKGNIRMAIQCFSEDVRLIQKHYVNSSKCLYRLLRISSTLSNLQGFWCFITLSEEPDLLTYVLEDQSKTSELKTIVLPFYFKSDHGPTDRQKILGKTNKHTEKISKTLSDIFDAKITMETLYKSSKYSSESVPVKKDS